MFGTCFHGIFRCFLAVSPGRLRAVEARAGGRIHGVWFGSLKVSVFVPSQMFYISNSYLFSALENILPIRALFAFDLCEKFGLKVWLK